MVLSVVKPVSKQVFKLLEFDYRTKIVSSQIIFNKQKVSDQEIMEQLNLTQVYLPTEGKLRKATKKNE